MRRRCSAVLSARGGVRLPASAAACAFVLALVLALVLVLAGALVSGCGSRAAEGSREGLLREYRESTAVRNDKFAGAGESSADRRANFAAYYTPRALLSALLSATPCRAAAGCPASAAAGRAVREFAGAGGRAFERAVLVRHGDGSLELITLYVARRSDGTAALVDSRGGTYPGGLDDFRRHNALLGPEDLVLTPRDPTVVHGGGAVVAVSGHTPRNWLPWLIGASTAVMAAATALAAVRRRRSAPGPWGRASSRRAGRAADGR
ncbi:hypothetical protein ACH4TU_07490 [Streptomyces physcomitrii]|uniref:hypothetical protein n=1 Tax=Streptomyces physcomitrii TaxID=2724184 RepID=UPI0011AB5BE3